MELTTERYLIRPLVEADVEHLVKYNISNKAHLHQWEPTRNDDYYSVAETKLRLKQYEKELVNRTSLHLAAFKAGEPEILALCSFTNIVYGPFQACNLGYSVAKKYEGMGMMTEVLTAAIDYVFDELKLHRVMANYIPNNTRSEALLNRLGFEQEGLAKAYLKIAGRWQDHILTAKISQRD